MAPQPSVTVVGHPFIPMGMGEHLRSVIRSFRAIGVNVGVRDVYGFPHPDPLIVKEFSSHLTEEFDSDVNIFCINGDEVDPVLRHLGNLPTEAHNIVYPAWELSKYPATWAEQLSRFDEIWTTSQFTHDSIKAAVAKPVMHIPLSGEVLFSCFMGRRYFGISESAFVFLFFFDFTSYIQRKNPFAVLRSFEELSNRLPNDDMQLVIKSKSGETRPGDYDLFRRSLSQYAHRVVLIDDVLSDSEIKNLLRCSDAFVSLHRSEGFGLGLITAMFLGKPVVATGYSGNQDYMQEDNSCLVRYELCNVPDGAYPFSEGQVWAEPDVPHAVDQMARLVSDRDYARQIGDKASRHIRVNFSHRAIGLRYFDRVRRVASIQDGLSSRSLVPSRLSRQREVEEGSEHHPTVPNPEVSTADFTDNVLREADVIARKSGAADCLRKLRQLSLEQFGELMISLPRTDYASLSSVLPRMASAEVQRSWTGSDGANLLAQTNTFVRMVSENFSSISGRSLSGKRILDFGCGYGRILRSMLYFSDPADLYGCDPWDRSIDLCEQDGLTVNLALSEYLPTHLPFTGRFDLIYAFSVFTHLSLRATRQCLDTLHGYIGENGVLVITVRPVEYWAADPNASQAEREQLVLEHNQNGFAFRPHERAAVDGDITYGDTSMTIPYLAENFDWLEIAKVEHFPADPYQIIIFLRSKRRTSRIPTRTWLSRVSRLDPTQKEHNP